MKSREAITAKVSLAREEILSAEAALEDALKTLKSGGVRAEKEILSQTLESAFVRLRAAHSVLAELLALLEEPD